MKKIKTKIKTKKNSTSNPSVVSDSGVPESRVTDAAEKLNVEIKPKTQRRRFTAEYKLRILEKYDNSPRGEKGALLRREGLYSSQIIAWRKAREESLKKGLDQKRGPKKKTNPLQPKLTALEKEVARLKDIVPRAQCEGKSFVKRI